MKLVAGVALCAAGVGLWAVDAWRGSNNDARSSYVAEHARQWLPEGGMTVQNGELVVATSVPFAGEPVVDDVTGFSLNVLRLERDVQIFQWNEEVQTHSDRDGNTRKTYTYDKVWANGPISSLGFDQMSSHRNSGTLPFPDRNFKPLTIRFGDVVLDGSYAGMLGASSRFDVTREMFDAMPDDLRDRFAIVDGRLFPNRSPQIGDIRVAYKAIVPRQATVVGEYRDGVIVPAATEAGTISLFRWGNLDVEQVVQAEQSESRTLGIVLKVVAGLIVAGGLTLSLFGMRARQAGGGSVGGRRR